ncbi:pollen-specific leucine-rich repeat extensin-like protein 1 [Impatiens glandulifera]|uniref:pollen-specific leucine-rich repeat extensin-like protein 1 n=1 Tax=Impatiens glandulifera TaxID=253017 RepID=UPI001FB0A0AF|nr:pollen-specific leucine-rich repeat extensin-like protein 1 [Impatiens glandulifera]
MPIATNDSTPPPSIGKIGPYTVFITPPATPKPFDSSDAADSHNIKLPRTPPPPPHPQPSPVQAPPLQFHKPAALKPPSDGSVSGIFWNAVNKVQNAHSSLDEYVAHWFGLNQSKYQWALDDYYESKGSDQLEGKGKGNCSTKVQDV